MSWTPIAFDDGTWVNRVKFDSLGVPAVLAPVNATTRVLWVTECWFLSSGPALITEDTDNIRLADNQFQNSEGFQLVYDSSGVLGQALVVTGNTWDTVAPAVDNGAVIRVVGYDAPVIANNHAYIASGGFPYGFARIEECKGANVSDNTVRESASGPIIQMTDCDGGVVKGNVLDGVFDNPEDIGILLDGTNDCVVASNQITTTPSAGINALFYGIHVVGDGNTVQGNVIRLIADTCIRVEGDDNSIVGNHMLPSALTPVTEIGIDIVSGANNAVFANYLGDSSAYNTADSQDAGTGTITTAAGGAIGGQFAY